MKEPARIVFAGSPDFAVPALQALQAGRHDVIAVLTQPDRPAGRGRKLTPCPVKVAAGAARVLQPETLRDPVVQAELGAMKPDLMVVVAYGLLLPEAILALPRRGCVNLHASLLPRWRGASPVQSSILAGDIETGVCLMQMDKGLDTGPVFARASLPIGPHETAGELHDRLAGAGAELLNENLDAVLDGSLVAEPQAENGVTHAGKIEKTDGLIDWSDSAAAIDRRIRAFNPWPVAFTKLGDTNLRCWRARVAAIESAGQPGRVLRVSDTGIQVGTGAGVIELLTVQPAGGRQMPASDFARSRDLTDATLGT